MSYVKPEPALRMKSLSFLARLITMALVAATPACAGLTPTAADLSTAFEPPRSWDAAIFFVFGDSAFVPAADYAARIEFHDGTRQRAVAASDLFDAPTGEKRTPWYRLRPDENGATMVVRVTLEHTSGARTTAEYPLTIQRDEYVTLYATVYTRDPAEWYMSMPRHRKSFPLHPSARVQPGDSLWISHAGRNRECFDCPR
jgi:hypothetical protein